MALASSLDAFISAAQKSYGKDIIFTSKMKALDIEWVPTGIFSLDEAFGKGIPRGRLIEIYGPESSGKTTLALKFIQAFQKASYRVLFVDAENALDPAYAKDVGVNFDEMPVSQPDVGEDALNLVVDAAESGVFGLIVIDSVDAILPRSMIEGQLGDASMATLAKLMSAACRKLKGACKNTKTTVLFTNQIRHKVGVFFGSPEFTSGGNALKFYSSIRIDIRKKETIEKDSKFIGITSQVKVVKNKVSPPFKIAMINILFGKGIDENADLRQQLITQGRMECRGSNFYLDGTRVGAGKVETDKWLAAEYVAYEKERKKAGNKKK